MKRATLVLAVLAMMLGGVGQAKADPIVAGSYGIYPIDGVSTGATSGPFSFGAQGSGGVTTTRDYPELIGGGARFTASVQYGASYGAIGLELSGTAIDGGWQGGPTAGGQATIAYQDTVSLVWRGDGVPLAIPGTNLDFILRPEGSISATAANSPLSGVGVEQYAAATVSIEAGITALTYTVQSSLLGNTGEEQSRTFFPTVSASYTIGPGGRTQFSYSLGVSVSTNDGTAIASFLHTLEPVAITFDNGQTPESLGYELVFDSGMQSPNLPPSVATPEPSTLTLLGIGSLGLLGYRWRRRKQARP